MSGHSIIDRVFRSLGFALALAPLASAIFAATPPAASALLSGRSEASVASGSVPLTVRSLSSSPQNDVPVFVGVPFPVGAVRDPVQIALARSGSPMARQVEVTCRYRDGSICWALLGFKATLAPGETQTFSVTYNAGAGADLDSPLAWSFTSDVVPLLPATWYATTAVFGPLLASEENTVFPGFEGQMRSRFVEEDFPAATANRSVAPFYDRMHALHMYLARAADSDSNREKAYLLAHDEAVYYRTNEIQQDGPYRGQYNGPAVGGPLGLPIDIGRLRRMTIEGLLEDYFVTGDPQSMTVARWMADQFRLDASPPDGCWRFYARCAPDGSITEYNGHSTERNVAFPVLGLLAFYEGTLETPYLDAAKHIADMAMGYQTWWAANHPSDPLRGGFVQDPWFDPSETSLPYAVSGFMSTLLSEAWIKLYRVTGGARYRDALLQLAAVLRDRGWEPAANSYWYVVRDTNTFTTDDLNPMFFEIMGFAWQATGDASFRDQGLAALRYGGDPTYWGYGTKQYNQAMRSSGRGLKYLQAPLGSVPLVLQDCPPASPVSLAAAPTTSPPGGTLTAAWCGIAAPTPTDWLGLYAPGAADTAFLAWRYTTGAASDSIPFIIPAALAPGTYELRLFADNSYTRLATSNPLTVTP